MSGHQHRQQCGGGVAIVDDSSSAIGGTTTTTRRGCSPPPATTSASIDGGTKILQKRWVCDVCKVKWFLDFQEACAHEKNCNGSANNIGVPPPPPPSSSSSHMAHCDVIEIVEETTSLIPTDSNDGTGLVEKANSGGGRQTLASIFRPQRGVSSTTKEQSKMTKKLAFTSISSSSSSSSSLPRAKMKKNKEATTSEVVPGITQAEYEEHLAAEKEHRRRTTRTSTRLAAIDEESTKNVQALKSTSNKRARLGRREERRDGRTNAVKMEVDDNSTDDDEADDECIVIDAFQPTTTLTKSNTVTKKKGLLSKQQLAEHQTVEFFAKRKKAAAEERERQKKREELRLLKLKDNMIDDVKVVNILNDGATAIKDPIRTTKKLCSSEVLMQTASSVDPTSGGASEQHSRQLGAKVAIPPAVRFPCPSHVVPTTNEDESMDIEVEQNSPSLQLLRETLRYQHLKPDMSSSPATKEDVAAQHSHGIFTSNGDEIMVKDETFSLLSSVFDLSAKKKEETKQPSAEDKNQLWVDKYAITNIPDDVLGANNKDASKKLLSFVEEWKVRRHKSVQDMGRVKSKGKRRGGKKKKSHGYDSDDSFLDDDEGGLENIFLITGPTGSGKSRIVHAIAEQSDCVVIEINSSEQRSGAALKRAIQETTQSHSNLAISSKKRQGLGKGDNDFFGSNANAGTVADEFDEDSDRWYESSDDEESVKESHSLTIILIDEVDLLFEEDTAFWPALAQVSQKAKCPIVLTASSLPAEMKNLRYQYISLERPPPQECSMKMAEVATAEGMHFYRATVEDISKRLELIAEICKCDMRKILNTMQIFRHAKSQKRSSKGLNDTNIFELLPTMHCSSALSTVVADRPLILSVEPRLVLRDKHTVITISGENFATASTNLFIGGRVCNHFRIVDDNKIIAVCPPCVIPDGVTNDAIYEDELSRNIDCLTCKYVDVVVSKKCANGLILHSSSSLAGTNSPESESWTLEYDMPLRDGIWEIKTTREDFIRKLKAQKLKQTNMARENDDGLMSSDEEEFDDNTNLAESNMTRQNIDDGEKRSTDFESNNDFVDPQALLDEATVDMEFAGELISTKPMASSETSQTPFGEINTLAEDLRRLSDAILMEDAFTDLAIPALAGSVEGFGFDTIESLNSIDSLSCMDPMIDKLSKEKNKKPPSFETLFATGANESGFFFGNTDAYVTYPNRKRDRQLLCYSELHSRGLGNLDNSACWTEENVEHSRSSLDDEDLCSSFLQLQTRAQFEDDILLRLQPPNTYTSPPLILAQTRNHGLTLTSTPLMQIRSKAIATNALRAMHSIVANCDLWYTGLRHDSEDCVHHVWRRDSILDQPLSLDYLPYLRAIAHHEVRVQRKFEDVMQDNGGRTRRRRSCVRRNYLDECADEQCNSIEGEVLHLARTYIINE